MLRTRLFLGLATFVVLLIGTGVLAVILLSRMAGQVDATVTGNYRSILVAQAMRLQLASLERETWASITGTNTPNEKWHQELERFEKNLATLTNSVATPDERQSHLKLAGSLQSFKETAAALRADGPLKARRDLYQLQITPAVLAMDTELQNIRDFNDRAIVATPGVVQKVSTDIIRLLIGGLFVVLLVSAFVFYRLSQSILEPIQSLTLATQELGGGRWNKPVPVVSHDELGELATAFNKMAAQLQEYRESTTHQIVQLHRTMESTLASFPDPIFVLNRSGQIQLKNPAAGEFSATLGLQDELPKPLYAIAEKALANNEDFLPNSFAEVVTYRLGGADRFFLPRALVMRDRENVLFGVAVVLNDVTRFRLLDAAKSNLVATVSHELKTPLTGLRMALHLLTEKTVGELLPKQEELLQGAQADAERLLRILNDLLDLARLDAGDAELHRERTAPSSLVRDILDQMGSQARAARVTLTGQADPDLPHVLIDQQRVSLVFTNLVGNAIKHSRSGHEVTFHAARSEDDGVEFTVSDQGPGIPAEFHSRIFDRFFRIPGQDKAGAGLGLSIAREIVVAHGGRVGLKSSLNHGSTFYVVLPTVD